MADKLPPESKESVIKGFQKHFSVSKNVVTTILESTNWNIGLSCQLFQTMSPKSGNSKPSAKAGSSKSNPNEAQSSKKKAGSSFNGSTSGRAFIKAGSSNSNPNDAKQLGKKKVGGNSNDGNSSKNVGDKRKQIFKELLRSNPISPSNNIPKSKGKKKNEQNVKNPMDNLKYAPVNVATSSSSFAYCNVAKLKPCAVQNQLKPQEKVVFEDSKKKKRAMLKEAYDIIKMKRDAADRIRDCIKLEIKIVILMRGCPGSGKSTHAREILMLNGVRNPEDHIFSTDNYFMDSRGNYNFDRSSLDKAHMWNQELVEKVMKLGLSPIVVDNTHVKAWEMMCYAQFAVRLGYVLETLEPPTPWFFNESVLAKKNSHGVRKDKIALMLHNYEPNLSGNSLLMKFDISYNIQNVPPQIVTFSKESVLNVINKAMRGKKISNESINKTTQNLPASVKNELQLTSTNNYVELVDKFNYNGAVEDFYKNREFKDKMNFYPSVNGMKLPSNYSDMSDDKKFDSECFGSPSSRNKTVKGRCADSTLPSYSASLHQVSNANLMDNPIDDVHGYSLVDPLTPQVSLGAGNSSPARSSAVPNMIPLDPLEFPSLSSSTSSLKKSNSNGDSTQSRVYEEKIKKLTELFPHLDKEFISDLCADPDKNLDDIVSVLLDSNMTTSNTPVPVEHDRDSSSQAEEESSSSDEEDNFQGMGKEKDVAMLIQLFPNIKELDIRDMYEKCSHEFKIALEFLLHHEPSETADNVDDADETDSSPLVEPVEIQDGSDSPDNPEEFDQFLKQLTSDTDLELIKEMSKTHDESPCVSHNEDTFNNNHYTDGNEWKIDATMSSQLKQIYSTDKVKFPFDSEYGLLEDRSESTENGNDNFKPDEDSLAAEEQQGGDSNSQINSYSSQSSSKDVVSGGGDCKESDSCEDKLSTSKTNSETFITLDRFAAVMNDVVLTNLDSHSGETSYGKQHVNTKPVRSDLTSKLLDWNFDKDSLLESVDNNYDFNSPKEQRERFNASGSHILNSSTNTNYKDFETLKRAQFSEVFSDKILTGTLNFVSCVEPVDKLYRPKSKLLLDKGTCTEDIETGFTPSGNDTATLLSSMFPNITPADLNSLLNSCLGDLNWAVGLLLDSGHEISPDFNPSEHEIQIEGVTDPICTSEVQEQSCQEDVPGTSEPLPTMKSKKRYSQRIPVDSINFIMNDESISSHVKKIRNARLGIVEPAENASEVDDEPSTSDMVYDRNVWNSSEEEDEEEDDNLDVALSTDLILALQAQFGGYIPNVVPDSQLVVSLPVYLVRQLHFCIMDSLSKQLEEEQKLIDKMIDEDESLARQLQELENELTTPNVIKQQSVQEIMDEELALKIHRSLNKGPSTEETVASKLAQQLLIERFPTMDPTALKTLLEDTDNSLDKASHLLEVAGYQRANPTSDPVSVKEMIADGMEMTREEMGKQVGAYREAAKVFMQIRHECFAKAQKAYSEGNKRVASYYSQMANWHSQRIEQANLLASTMLLKSNKDLKTLDLHFLRVCEAMQVLNIFLDTHINSLKDSNKSKCQLYIITGRGLHSPNGVSKIRPATMAKLKQRSISFKMVNPGLLMIDLKAKTPLTYQK